VQPRSYVEIALTWIVYWLLASAVTAVVFVLVISNSVHKRYLRRRFNRWRRR
jgi:hypothetical protein